MSLDPDTLSRLLHDLTPEPPVDVTIDDIAARLRHRRRTRTAATIAAICLLVIAAVTVPLALDRRTGSNNGGPAPADRSTAPKVCVATAVDISLAWKSTSGGGLAGALVVNNQTNRTCILRDRPMLAPLDRAGKPLGAVQFEPNQTGPGPLLMHPGATAVTGVGWSGWCKGPVPTDRIRISWPGGGSRVVVASGTHLASSCSVHGLSPAGALSSTWFSSLLPGRDRAVPVTSNQTYMSGQVTLQPPTRPASDFPATASDALTADSLLEYGGGGTVTIEYGLFSDNVQGTYNPATKLTKFRAQRVPAYLVIVRTARLALPGAAGTGPGIQISGIEAATGKRLGLYGERGDPSTERPARSGCSWTLKINNEMVTGSSGTTAIAAHVGDHLQLVNGSGCTNQPVLRAAGGTAAFATNSDTDLTVEVPGTAQLQVVLIGCNGLPRSASPCFGPIVNLATLDISAFQ